VIFVTIEKKQKKVLRVKKKITFVTHLAEHFENCFYVRAFEN